MSLPRLRQVVLVARDLATVAAELEAALGVRGPFRDPGVGHFGLENAVYAVGDTFVEIVSPVQPDTAAGRHLERHGGDGGYMVMFELDDEAALRQRLAARGFRVIWETTHDDIVDLHLHPKDLTAAIVAVDVTAPHGSWRWGGPAWVGRVPEHGPAAITGVTVASTDPEDTARRWADALGIEPATTTTLLLAGGAQQVDAVPAADGRTQGVVSFSVSGCGAGSVTVGGVTIDRRP